MKRAIIFATLAILCLGCGSLHTVAMPRQSEAAKPAAKTTTGVDPEKDKAIRKLLDLTGSAKLGIQIMQQMVAAMRQSQTGLPDEFWSSFLNKTKPDELIDLIVPIYDKHFTREDIDGLIAFYQTPLGQKTIATLPAIVQESTVAGQEWGRAKGEEIMREIEKQRAAQKPKSNTKATGKTKGKK